MIKNFKLKIKNYLEWLQALPENKKKIILWIIVAILAAIMGFFWINSAIKSFSKLTESANLVNFPSVDINMPSLDILQTTTPTSEK